MKLLFSTALVLCFGGLISAQEKKDDKATKPDPVGTWTLEYEIGDMKRSSTLSLKMDGDKLVGTMNWPDQKDAKLQDVKLKDDKLTFKAERVLMDNKLPITYSFTVTADKLKGKGVLEFNGEKRDFEIEGKREKKDK